jgi:hypothetical protein
MEGLTIGGIIGSIVATGLVFCFGFAFRELLARWKNRHFVKIWKQFISLKSAKVVITTRPGPESSSSLRVSLPEVRAFQSIEQISVRLGMEFDLTDSTVDLSNMSQENLILLGGPKANDVSKYFWSEVEKRVPYTISLESQCIVSGSQIYTPERDDSGLLSVDYSLVVKMHRENSSNYLFLFAGCHGFGTLGSTRIVSDTSEVAKIVKRVSDKEFVAIVKSNIVKGVVDTVEVIDVYIFA